MEIRWFYDENFTAENYTKFINNVQKKYNSKFLVWVIIETVDFRNISKLYKNMKVKDKNN